VSRSYCFDDPYTGERAKLDDVDRELCDATGWPYSSKNYCPLFDALVELGFACLMWASRTGYKEGAWHVTSDMLRAYRAYYADDPSYTCIDPLMGQLQEYLAGGRYIFSAWG
jgi:hypothetical protein